MPRNNATKHMLKDADEREDFERCMQRNYPSFPLEIRSQRYEEIQQGHFEYKSAGTQHMWNGWKLARIMATKV
ncbi:hypothetical protein AVV28_gp66 [Achromobacter phage JWX]|uniref:Uncharacterized protein n=2 Tax=root TaxID=1 RepID=A0A0B5A6Q1_9CAUD|nr:hypothetical protein AVV28_gp66 [Achromobacter phage JWX]AJD82816.1 hypothetical protein JWX_00051 [Achromobacter phage JWX]WLW38469.1 hypothetical protein JWT_00046 [Achromobacter phage JWT]